MNGREFINRIKKHGKLNGIEVRLEQQRGKGSQFTIVKDRKKEIGKGLYNAMLKQLGIEEQ